jgi:hypothetical protein
MATTNKAVSSTWTRVADLGAEFLLSALDPVEIAVTGANATVPTVSAGHYLEAGAGMTRDQAGAGAVWARALGVPPATVVVS